MKVVGLWSWTDAILLQTVTKFLRADFEVINAIFESLSGTRARQDAFLAAANEALPKDDVNILQAVLAAQKPSRDRRNKFVHHLWGRTPELPNRALLGPPGVVTKPLLDIRIKVRDLTDQNEQRWMRGEYNPDESGIDFSKILVFKQEDLEADATEAERASSYAMDLHFLFSSVPSMHDSTRSELLNQPLIRQHYEKLSAQGSQ